MFLLNNNPAYRSTLDPTDAATLGPEGAAQVAAFLAWRDPNAETPLVTLPGLAAELGIGALHLKDEGKRLGLGSFKALGGAYAVVRLVLEQASRQLGRVLAWHDLVSQDVRAIAAQMVFACATDGNHGRSVAQGAQLVGARAVIFVHKLVSQNRIDAIARYGAEVRVVDGSYDESVDEAARVAQAEGWTPVSDTSWPGYERIPLMVMQGYTAMIDEAKQRLDAAPTHVFVQAGVGGVAAAVAAYLALTLGEKRPVFVVVEPESAACILAAARTGTPSRIPTEAPTVMAMLECCEASPVAWRVLSRVADGFMTVTDDEAVAVMNRLARPVADDPRVVAGESGGAGLAGLIHLAGDSALRATLGLDAASRALVFNTEGATDPARYAELVGVLA
jgi:diaminopropionate ammonia-lyase